MNIKENTEEENPVFSEDDLEILLEDCKSSARDIEKVIKWMRHKFGRKFFTPNITTKITEPLNSLIDLHEGEAVIFKDKAG